MSTQTPHTIHFSLSIRISISHLLIPILTRETSRVGLDHEAVSYCPERGLLLPSGNYLLDLLTAFPHPLLTVSYDLRSPAGVQDRPALHGWIVSLLLSPKKICSFGQLPRPRLGHLSILK